MKKTFIWILLIFIIITGCKCNKESKQDNRKIAIEEAQRYIKEKYNIDLQENNIIDVNIDKNYDYTGITATGYAEVLANYNGNSFKITLNYHNKKIENYYDNYEKNVVLEAINNFYYPQLNISKENSITYIPEYIVYGSHTNEKFIDIDSFINKINNSYQKTIYIVTTDEIVNNNIISLGNVTIYIYKLNNNPDLSRYSHNNFIAVKMTSNILSFEEMTGNNDLDVKDKYYCLNTCTKTEYKTISLDNDIYLKYAISNASNNYYDIYIEKINVNDASNVVNELTKCGNFKILDIYKLSAGKTKYTDPVTTLISYNIYSKNQNDNIKIHLYNGTTSCNTLNTSTINYIRENSNEYLIITEDN